LRGRAARVFAGFAAFQLVVGGTVLAALVLPPVPRAVVMYRARKPAI